MCYNLSCLKQVLQRSSNFFFSTIYLKLSRAFFNLCKDHSSFSENGNNYLGIGNNQVAVNLTIVFCFMCIYFCIIIKTNTTEYLKQFLHRIL